MKKSIKIFIVLTVLVGVVLTACSPKEPVLTVSGLVEKTYTLKELQALPQVSTDYTDKDGETTTYNGMAFSALFSDLKLPSDPTAVKMIAVDDYEGEVTYEEIAACDKCIIAINEDGSLRSVLPDFSGKVNIKDLVKIDLK